MNMALMVRNYHKITYNYKVWLECNGEPVLGKGRYSLLKNISRTESLKASAEKMGISYKTAQNYLRKIETKLGIKITDSQKGGRGAGGKTTLNKKGFDLLKRYEKTEKVLKNSFKTALQKQSR
jgi:molybdate transport system regulatory protein